MPFFKELISYDRAQEIINKTFPTNPLGAERIALLESFRRVAAEDIKSHLAIPPFDRSTVDGYAVRATDTFCARENQAAQLLIIGAARAGRMPKVRLTEGSAVQIVTGAPLPKGADAVVMIEDTERKDKDLSVYNAVVETENVMKAGSDVKPGELVVRKHQIMGYAEIGLAAAVGVSNPKVFRIPRIAILSTGPEIAAPGRRLSYGKVYDINAYSLSAAVTESGGKPVFLGVIPDDRHLIEKALEKGLEIADVIITSGGVSVGPRDLMPRVLSSMGEPGVIISGIAVKPGKPVTIAFIQKKPVLALPGHPTSALMTFHLFARPLVERLAGREASIASELIAFAGTRLFPAKGRRTFIMVKLSHDERQRWIANPVAPGESGAIATLARSDGFVEIPESIQFVDFDQKVTVHLFRCQLKNTYA